MNVFKKNAVFFAVTLAAFCLAPAAASAQSGQPQEEKLLNGMKVLMWNDPKAEKVSLRIRIHSGSAFDPQGREGLMQLLSDVMFPNEAARDFFTEDLGGSLEVKTTYDYIEISASSTPDKFLTMLETISTAVTNPGIDREITTQVKTAHLKRLEAIESDMDHIANAAVASRLFGTFPYGRPQAGIRKTVEKIEFADLIEARQRFLTADNATLALAGNFDRVLGFRAIRRYFGNWLKADRKTPSTFKQPDAPSAEILTVAVPQTGTSAVRFAIRGPARGEKEFGAALIFAAIVDGRLKARTSSSERVFARSEAHILPGSIMIGFPAHNETEPQKAVQSAKEIFSKAISDPVTEAEFSAAKQAVQLEWNKRDTLTFWLDADTYKTAGPASDMRTIESATLADVRAFAERAGQRPVASVFLNTTRPSN